MTDLNQNPQVPQTLPNQSAPLNPPPLPVQPVAAPVVPSQATVSVSQPSSPKKLNIPKIDPKSMVEAIKKMPLKFKIMAGFVFTLLILLVLVSFTAPGKKVREIILPSPSPIPQTTPVGEVFEPSPYAKDEKILEIEKAVNSFDSELSKTNLREDTLRIPNLDWEVNFKK